MSKSSRVHWILLPLLIGIIGWLWYANFSKLWNIATLPDLDRAVADLRAERERLDETVWADEVLAQEYEKYFIKLWDDLRAADDKIAVIEQAGLGELQLGLADAAEDQGDGVMRTLFAEGGETLDQAGWSRFLASTREAGYRLVQCEFHHKAFQRDAMGKVTSDVSAVLHLENATADAFFDLNSLLAVEWSAEKDTAGHFYPARIDASRTTLLQRKARPVFESVFSTEGVPMNGPANWEDILVSDLDHDGRSDIIQLRTNRIYWNRGAFQFEAAELCATPAPRIIGGVLADFTGDGLNDLLVLQKPQASGGAREIDSLVLYAGDADGKFPGTPTTVLAQPIELTNPDSCAVGDVDGDGDLDLWLTQYKMPYRGGQMPTPYFDANDGWPSYLLLGNGRGQFVEATESANLSAKRHRRTVP